MSVPLLALAFAVVCLASYQIGRYASAIRLPYITGYLFAGVLVGSFGLGLIPSERAPDLRFVDELALAVIAFVAGSELSLPELRRRLRPILLSTGGILVVALTLLAGTLFVLTAALPFAQGWGVAARVATALLGATILLALSPPSTIAVIKEIRASGPFTRTALSVTVFMDVVIIVLFAVSASVASALLLDVALNLGFVGLLAAELATAVGLGLAAGQLLRGLLATRLPRLAKTAFVLVAGFGIYELARWVKMTTLAAWGTEFYIEPLLIAMIAGFVVANFTRHRDEFEAILHDVGPAVYVAFFTLTGLTLKLDLLWATLPVALALFGTRLVGIGVGAYAGARLAGEPPRVRRLSWMAFITQAGIALGLAREVAVQFPMLGGEFATLVVSVVVLNEVFGPLFLKAALRRVGEAHEPETAATTAPVVILGIEGPSVALARRLGAEGRPVRLAGLNRARAEAATDEGLDAHHLDAVDEASLRAVVPEGTLAVVALFGDDALNLEACRIARDEAGVARLVARVSDLSLAPRFAELGVLVVDATSALVNLLERAVEAPQSVALFLHQDPRREVAQLRVEAPDLDGLLVRDLRLPGDVLLLDIARDRGAVVPHGHTALRLGDEVTLVGEPDSLLEVAARFGG